MTGQLDMSLHFCVMFIMHLLYNIIHNNPRLVTALFLIATVSYYLVVPARSSYNTVLDTRMACIGGAYVYRVVV